MSRSVWITVVFWVVQQHFRWEYSATKCFEVNQKSFWWRENVFITNMYWMTQKEFFRLQNERQFYVSFVDNGTWDTLRYLKIPHENCLLQQYSVCFLNEPKTKTKKLERIKRTSRRNTLLSVSCVLLNCSCFNVNVAWIIHDCLRIFSGFLFGSKTLPTSRQNRI